MTENCSTRSKKGLIGPPARERRCYDRGVIDGWEFLKMLRYLHRTRAKRMRRHDSKRRGRSVRKTTGPSAQNFAGSERSTRGGLLQRLSKGRRKDGKEC
jgi:hypothetical protein